MTKAILLIDTSTPTARVALIRDNTVLAEKEWPSGRELGKKIIQEIDSILKETSLEGSQLSRIAVHGGPGGYSSLRVGVVTGTVLALSWGCELVEISTAEWKQQQHQATHNQSVTSIQPHYTTAGY